MEEVKEEVIFKAVQEIAAMPIEEFEKLVAKIEEEQPDLMSYLSEIDGEIQKEEWGFMFYNSVLIWFLFAKGEGIVGKITRQMIEEGIEDNFQLLEGLWANQDFGGAVTEMFETYPQKSLLNFITTALAEDPILGEKNKPALFVYLKTVIDLFDKVVKTFPPT